jgi:hypothetical protein
MWKSDFLYFEKTILQKLKKLSCNLYDSKKVYVNAEMTILKIQYKILYTESRYFLRFFLADIWKRS